MIFAVLYYIAIGILGYVAGYCSGRLSFDKKGNESDENSAREA